MTIYSSRREPSRKPPTSGPRDQGVIDTTGHKVTHGPAPKAAPVPSLFAAAPLGVNPLTGRAWE